MSNSSEDQLEWWRMTERVIDQIPEISDAIIAIQGRFLLIFRKFLKTQTSAVTHSRPLPGDLPVMEQGQIEKVRLDTK